MRVLYKYKPIRVSKKDKNISMELIKSMEVIMAKRFKANLRIKNIERINYSRGLLKRLYVNPIE